MNMHSELRNSPLKAVSVFTGAGGLDIGFEAAGFKTLVTIEKDPDARATIELNRPEWGLIEEGDVLRIRPDAVLAKAGCVPGEVDVLIGGPPCQPFSKSAFWARGETRRLNDPRAETIGAMMDIAEALLPRAIVIENVRGIAYRKKDEALRLVRQRLRAINKAHAISYRTSVLHLHATDFGVPQIRERAFIIALRDGGAFRAPLPTHARHSEANGGRLSPCPRAWDALAGMAPTAEEAARLRLSGKWAGLIPSIPEGANYLWHTKRGGGLPLFGWRTRYWSFLLKLAKDQPSWTIQAEPGPATGPFHWDDRLLSVAEMARIQTFPVGWRFAGDYRSARRQIGNAVPAALAEAVAWRLRSVLLGEPYNKTLTLAVKRRDDLPAATSPVPVPPAYLPLMGEHRAHPGHGKGPGALRVKPTNPSADVSQNRREGPHPVPVDLEVEQHAAAQAA